MGTIKEHECKHCGAMTTQDDEQCYKNTNNMGTTNRAEELAKEYSLKMNGINFDNLFPNTDETTGEIGIKDFIAGYNSSQSEIDELTKEKSLFIEKYTKSCNEVQKLEKVNDELTKEVEHKNHTIENDAIHIETLTKEVERLRKGIDWTRAEYIKCVNDSDEITEKLEELLTTH